LLKRKTCASRVSHTRLAHVESRQRPLRDDDFRVVVLRAVARPPRAPAVRTDIVPRPVVRDVELREVVRDAVARPPFAPAFFFCTVVPARPPLAPAALTVIDRRAVVLRAVVLRAVVLRAVVLRAVVLRAVVVFRAIVLRAVVFRAAVLRAVVVRAVVFRVAVLRPVVVFLRDADDERAVVVVFPRDDVPPLLRDEPDDADFVSPACERCLLTVRAAISFARPLERPCLRSESLMCSYWRSRFAPHDCGMVSTSYWFPGRSTHARNVRGLFA